MPDHHADDIARILSGLSKIENRQSAKQEADEMFRDQMRDALSDMKQSIHRVETLITGGGDPTKGLITKVDRLEQESARHRIALRTIFGALVSGIVGLVIKHFMK